ncbi:unnamed protein product [Absidia cylindrospora]
MTNYGLLLHLFPVLENQVWELVGSFYKVNSQGAEKLEEAHCNNVIPMSLNVKDLALVNPSYQENSTASGLRRFDFGKNWCSANRAKTIPQISIQKKRSLLSKQTQYSHVITALFPQVSLLSLNYNQSNSAKVYCGTLLLLS